MHTIEHTASRVEIVSASPLRPYQERAVTGVEREWQSGHRAVCLVAPTGAGKTRLAEEFIRRSSEPVLFLVHRRELVEQTRQRFEKHFDTACIAPGYPFRPDARVQIATVQTLLAREHRPPIGLLVLDEAHHYRAAEWQSVIDHYGETRTVGLTATPERQTGEPLGDIFSALVVAAGYRELVAGGYLVDARVYAPETAANGLAQDPVKAWRAFAEGSRAFLFASRVEHAERLRREFISAGVRAETIEANTCTRDRMASLARFVDGDTRVLTNVNVLTEGIDVPAARTCILARTFGHVSSYLQAVGRVLRPHPEKPHAVVIDLTGATLSHGYPTEDRRYSLTGKAIERTSEAPMRQCQQCGSVFAAGSRVCPYCGFEPPLVVKPLRIYDYALSLVYAGAETPVDAKEREWKRVRSVAEIRGFGIGWAAEQYKRLFSELPELTLLEQKLAFSSWRDFGKKRGFKPGFAASRYRALFGKWPPRGW